MNCRATDKDLGGEISRFFVQLRIFKHSYTMETAARGKPELREGNNPNCS